MNSPPSRAPPLRPSRVVAANKDAKLLDNRLSSAQRQKASSWAKIKGKLGSLSSALSPNASPPRDYNENDYPDAKPVINKRPFQIQDGSMEEKIKGLFGDYGFAVKEKANMNLLKVKILLFVFLIIISMAANGVLANKLKKLKTSEGNNHNVYNNHYRGVVENITGLLIGSYLIAILFLFGLYVEVSLASLPGLMKETYKIISKYFWYYYGALVVLSLVFFGVIVGYANHQIPTLTKEEIKARDL